MREMAWCDALSCTRAFETSLFIVAPLVGSSGLKKPRVIYVIQMQAGDSMLELERVQQLGDAVLIERLTLSAKADRQLTVRLLAEMGEVHARGLFRDLGFSTMFEYATRKLGMSEAEAALRLRAAKLARSFPVALEMLARSELNLTTLSLLAPVLTADTLELLEQARFKSKQQVLELLVQHTPKPDVPDSIRRLPPPRPSARAPQLQPASQPLSPLAAAGTVAPAPSRTTSGDVVPLSPERHKISFSASQRVRELLEQARDLRRHRYPSGDLEPLFEHALELLIAHEKKRQCGQTATPRAQPTAAAAKPDSRYIPRALRRQVWARDGGQCRFIAPDGDRCQARSRLEFHHVVAFARGGPTREDNIVLLCRAHNALMAEREYGRSLVQARIASSAQA